MDNKILYTAKFTHHDLKFHKVWWKSDKRFGSWSGQTDGQAGRFLYTPPNYVCVCVWGGGINIWNCRKMITIICPAINKEKYIVKLIATLFIQPKKDIVSEFVLYLQMVVKKVVSLSCMLFAEMA